MDPVADPDQRLLRRLEPGETLRWHGKPARTGGSGPWRPVHLVLAAGCAFVVVALMMMELELDAPVYLAVAAGAFAATALLLRRFDRVSGDCLYAVTDRRLLILEGDNLRVTTPGQASRLDVEPQPDGTFDLVWGELPPGERLTGRNRPRRRPGLHFRHAMDARMYKLGFLGLASSEPAVSFVRGLLRQHHHRAAAAVPPSVAQAAGSDPKARHGWKTVREAGRGLAIDLPESWSYRLGRIGGGKLFGIRYETPPRWFDGDEAGWNRLEADTGLENAALQLTLDPGTAPERLEEVLDSRAASALNLQVVRSDPRVSVNGFTGFSVVHDLKGAGLGVSVGPVSVRTAAMKADLLQTQYWLREGPHRVHAIFTCPREARELQEGLERVVRSLRLGD